MHLLQIGEKMTMLFFVRKHDRDEVLQYSPNIIEEKIKDPNFLAKLFWIDNEYVLSLPSLQNSKTEFYNDFVNAISQTK